MNPHGKPTLSGEAGGPGSGDASDNQRKIGFWSVAAIGVGGMVGGGIFAVLGLAVALAGGGAPLGFLAAGLVALLTAYSYAHLSVSFPSQGGSVIFLDRAFGGNYFTGSLNTLLWLSYVVMLALYAFAFGSYGATFLPLDWQGWGRHVLMNLAIIVPTALNLFSADIIGKAETYLVAIKITLLAFFAAVGVFGIQPQRLAVAAWSPPLHLLAGGMIIFVAYEGFELIANTAQDVRDYRRVLPRAYYASVGFVILLYILVSAVTVGGLPLAEIAKAKDYALAAAAKPFLGAAGFRLIAVAALLSTMSAINATLYGSARLAFTIAKEGELPAFLEKKVWNKHIEGLLITSVLALFLANSSGLSAISTLGSAGFLIIFAAVNAANWLLHEQTGGRRWISGLGAAACLGALGALLWQSAGQDPGSLWILAALVGCALGVEGGYRLFRRGGLRLH